MQHSSKSPSRLKQILECPGSVALIESLNLVGETRNEAADEGSLLHNVMENLLVSYVLLGTKTPGEITQDEVNKALQIMPNKEEDYSAAIFDCLDYLDNLLKTFPIYKLSIEEKVSLYSYHVSLVDVWGTADLIIRTPLELHVIDWKFGKGVPVYAPNNDQLYAYAAGGAENIVRLNTYDKIHIHVIQPRLDIYDTEPMTPAYLANWIYNRLVPGIERADSKHAPFNPGVAQCKWCLAKFICRARASMALQVAADVFAAHIKYKAEDISLEEISDILLKAPIYEHYISDLRTYVTMSLLKGRSNTKFKLVAGRSIRKWKNEQEAFVFLAPRLDPDKMFKSILISPAGAEKIVRGLKKDERFQTLIDKPIGKPTMVPMTDPRPALQIQDAEQIFRNALEQEGGEE